MAQPTINILTISPQQAAWEANVNTNFATLKAAFEDDPLIVKFYATQAALPSAATNELTLALVNADADSNKDGLYWSDGTVWHHLGEITNADSLQTLRSYAVAGLPGGNVGEIAYASDGRKNGEAAAAGTGVQVFFDGTNWIAVDTGQTVAA